MRPRARLLCTLVCDCQTTRVVAVQLQCVQPVGGLMQTRRLLPIGTLTGAVFASLDSVWAVDTRLA